MGPRQQPRKKTNNKEEIQVVVVVPPDGGYSWLIVAASFYSNFVFDGCFYSFSVYLKAMEDHYKFSKVETTFVGSVFQAVYYFSGPFACAMVNHFGFRATSLAGTCLVTTGFLTTSFARNYGLVVLVYGFVAGVGAGCCYTASIIVVSYHFEQYRALATGMATCGSSIGALCLSTLLEYVLSTYGIETALRVQSGLVASTILCALIYRSPNGTNVFLDEETAEMFSTELLLSNTFMESEADLRNALRSSIGVHSKSLHSAISNTHFQYRYRAMLNNQEQLSQSETKLQKFINCVLPCLGHRGGPKTVRTRPFDRNDIFFRGSIIDVVSDVSQSKRRAKKRAVLHACLNPDLFTSIPFVCLLLCMFTFTMSQSTPYMFLVDRAVDNAIESSTAKWLLPTISVGNTFGRIAAGLVSFVPWVNLSYLVAATSAAAGVLSVSSAFVGTASVSYQFFVAFWLGLLFAFSPTLRTLSYVRYIGMDLLTSAFGIGLMFAGVAALSGTPIASMLKAQTGTYAMSFVFSGGNILVSSGFAFLAEFFYKRSMK